MKRFSLLFFLTMAGYGYIVEEVNFSPETMRIEDLKNYKIIKIKGTDMGGEEGYPMLPYRVYTYETSSDEGFKSLEITSMEYVDIKLDGEVMPVPKHIPISLMRKPEIKKGEVYSKDEFYPETPVKFLYEGRLKDKNLISVIVYPVLYNPVKKILRFYTRISFVLNTELRPIFRTNAGGNLYRSVIITSEKMRAYFQPLSDWHTEKGIKDTIVAVESIIPSFPGRDPQERIREFIKWAYANWGIEYVILGGDVDVIPHRKCYVMEIDGNDLDTIPTDMYYACLDGDWDANKNNVFGEVRDSVDLYPEVAVGRITFDNSSQIEGQVNKIIHFEKNPIPGFIEKLLLPAETLWADLGYSGSYVNNFIANIVSNNFQKSKLYEDYGNINSRALKDSLNSGFSYVHYASHGNFSVISTGPDAFWTWDAASLTNGYKTSISNGICCLVGGFDREDCILEEFMENSNGGTVAWIGNSRYGWGNPPTLGEAEKMDTTLFHYIFNEDVYYIGDLVNMVKVTYAPIAEINSYMRWSLYEWTLFGDPTTPAPTEEFKNLTVNHPVSVPPEEASFDIEVRRDMVPVNKALVLITHYTDDEVDLYEYSYTNENGVAHFEIEGIKEGSLYVNVTARNSYPYKGSIPIMYSGPVIKKIPDTLYIYTFDSPQDSFLVKDIGTKNVLVSGMEFDSSFVEWVNPSTFSLLPSYHIYVNVKIYEDSVEEGVSYTPILIQSNTETSPDTEWIGMVKGDYPCIRFSPDTLYFDYENSKEYIDSFMIINRGVVNLYYTIKEIPDYVLNIYPGTGEVLPSDTVMIYMTLDTTKLHSGEWVDSFLVENNDPGRGKIYYYFHVENYSPLISVTPDTLRFLYYTKPDGYHIEDYDIIENNMDVSNVGEGTLKVDTIVPSNDWISYIEPVSFDVPANNSMEVKVRVDASDLDEGIYHSFLTINSNSVDKPQYKEPVELVVVPLERDIEVFPDTVKIDVQVTNKGEFYITNWGNEDLEIDSIKFNENVKWLVRVYPNKWTLHPLDTITIKVVVDPEKMDHNSEISIISVYSDDPDEPQINVYVNPYNNLGIYSSDSIPEEPFLAPVRVEPGNIMYIDYGINLDGEVEFNIYDITGRIIFTKDLKKRAGYHTLFYDMRDRRGRKIGRGIYFIEMKFKDQRFTEKMIILG